MKYLKRFLEHAVIMPWDMDGLIEDLLSKRPRTIQEADDIAEDYGVDIVTYDQFMDSIDDEMRAGAPPKNQFMFGPPPEKRNKGGVMPGRRGQRPGMLGGRMPGGRPPPGMRHPGGMGGPPPSGLHFTVMNKHTNKMNLVVDYHLFINWLTHMSPPQLQEIIKSILGHESIHWQQFQKMGADPNVYMVDSPKDNPKGYLGHFTELMAHAYSIVDEMWRMGSSKEEILDVINKTTSTDPQKGGSHIYNRYLTEFKDTQSKEIKQLRKYVYQYTQEYWPEEEQDDPITRHKSRTAEKIEESNNSL